MAKVAKKNASIAVKFGGVSIGQDTARIGIRISRADVSVEDAVEMFVGKRITGTIKAVQTNESTDQQTLDGMDDPRLEVEGTFDVKRIAIGTKDIGLGLQFTIEDIDVGTLSKFAKREGRLLAQSVITVKESHVT